MLGYFYSKLSKRLCGLALQHKQAALIDVHVLAVTRKGNVI